MKKESPLSESLYNMITLVLWTGSACLLLFSSITNVWYAVGLVATVYVVTGGWKFLWVFHRTWPRDLRSLFRLTKTKLYLRSLKSRNATVVSVFQENVRRHPHRTVFYHEDTAWSFQDLDLYSNSVANCLTSLGFRAGDEVALFMESKPEYVGLWLGCAKVGVVAALINTNQRHETLIHSITVINCKALIFGNELSQAVKEVVGGVNKKRSIEYLCLGEREDEEAAAASTKKCSSEVGEAENAGLEAEWLVTTRPLHRLIDQASSDGSLIKHKGNFTDRLFYIYTSGTTGLPKAAIIKHCRYIWIGSALRTLSGMRRGSTIYTCIPLYHLAGGVLGTNQCLIWGDSMAIRHKFSASKFWEDCVKYKCDTAQYIGEICRYLLAQPPCPSDQQHCVKTIFGNGLRREIWAEFVKRFAIAHVGEFYGSTEGNANIINNDNREGACGFISQIWPSVYPVALIKVDEVTNEPVRGTNGLCVRAGPGECGEFVGKIVVNDASRAFDGYVDKRATEKKIVRDVFRRGDAAFLSGDLLTMDDFGYVYFKDRTGDTFRWKGENCSTTEIEALISNVLEQTDCIVYGVDVPFCEGKAGMAAILDTERTINLENFLRNLRKIIPIFSVPLFVRLVDQMEATGTYKLPKTFLQKQGYDPDVIKDPLFLLDARKGKYLPLDASLYQKVVTGEISL